MHAKRKDATQDKKQGEPQRTAWVLHLQYGLGYRRAQDKKLYISRQTEYTGGILGIPVRATIGFSTVNATQYTSSTVQYNTV
jgi:hypothetical protein